MTIETYFYGLFVAFVGGLIIGYICGFTIFSTQKSLF